ncbi:Spy0128 family protein [Faecalibaculum rodentium]|uniref:Spy0128 family protein n=11 Tax=Faecalibaculum rodentium TaxID=1702221 RepID=UPI00261DBDDC|nr:FctA domain-containing protein [Faecalibaculum rodentium]
MKRQLNGLAHKVLSILLAGMMVWTQTGLNVFADNQNPEDLPTTEQTPPRDTTANPEITIQHYLNFSAVSMGLITAGPDKNTSQGTVVYPLRNTPDYSDNFDWNEFKANYNAGGLTRGVDYEVESGVLLQIYNKEARGVVTNGQGAPEYGLILKDGQMAVHDTKKMLFQDETVTYHEKPYLDYMNRLNNNDNYELKAVLVGYDLSPGQKEDVEGTDFHMAEITGDINEKNPVVFTNNPNYSETIDGQKIVVDQTNPVRMGDHWVIYVKEGTTIRLLFDPTSSTYDKNDVNFFDYDISDGNIYLSDRANPSNPSQILSSPVDSNTPLPTSSQEARQGEGYITYGNTYQQGINSPSNYTRPGAKLAFGNSNTGSGLANETLKTGDVVNNINKTNGNVNALGSVFDLATGLNDDGTPAWNTGISAPDLFTTDETKTVRGKTNYINQFGLRFNRSGGTYILEDVTKKGTSGAYSEVSSASNLSSFRGLDCNSKVIWSNDFWPMDAADSYGTDGHDLKFGAGQTAGTYGAADPQNRYFNRSSSAANQGKGTLPIADSALDHNSYFGMSFTTDFYLDPGYSGPLRYYFYGDDDMFVFLSKVTTDDQGNETLADTVKVADVGGVHSSVGMYTNLWPYVNGGKPIPYPDKNMSEADKKAQVQHYRLSVFYTERGASGSSCFMRLTVPFEPSTYDELDFKADLNVDKEVKTQVPPAESGDAQPEKYSFLLNLKQGEEISVTGEDGQTSTRPATFDEAKKNLVNIYAYTIKDIDTDQTVDSGYIADGGSFELADGQRFTVKGLPEGSLYRVEEIKLDSSESTTFVSGQVDKDGNTNIQKDFQEGNTVSGSTQQENYVKFVNALDIGMLTLNKEIDPAGGHTTTEDFSFRVKLEATEGSVVNSLSVLRNGLQEQDIAPNADGEFEVTLHWNDEKNQYDTVTLYNIPLKSKYTVTEISNGNYLPSDITVTGGVNNTTTLAAGMVQGTVDANGPITETNRPNVTVNYTNVYAPNATARIVAEKTIDGRKAAAGGETFTFQLEGANPAAVDYLKDNSPLLAQVTVKEGEKTATAEFAPMHFTHSEIGEYLFNVTELGSGTVQNGLEYDDTTYQVKVVVQNAMDADGNPTQDLEAVVTWSDGTTDEAGNPVQNTGSSVTFTNKVKLEAEASINFTKNIQGEGSVTNGIAGDKYTFTLTPADTNPDAPMPKETTVTIINDGRNDSYNGTFGPISYTRKDLGKDDADNVYEYVIQEQDGQVDGLLTDETKYLAKIKVSKTAVNGVDQLTAVLDSVSVMGGADSADNSLVFANIYQRAQAVINVRKTLDGRPMREGEVFAFELLKKGSSTVLQTLMLRGIEGQSTVTGSFEPIEFLSEDSQDYIVREIKGNDPEITYDTKEHTVSVVVTETEDRTLQAAVSYDGAESEKATALDITNIWNTSVEWAPSVTKETLGGSPADYTFQMELDKADNASFTGSDKATSDDTGKISFDPIRFTKPGHYKVTVSEVKGADDKILYDDHKVVFNLTVKADAATGLLTVEEAVENNASTVFTNDAGLRLTKTIVAGTDVTLTDADYAKKFTFNLTLSEAGKDLNGSFQTVIRDANDIVQDEGQTVITNGKGTMQLSHGQTAYLYGLPAGVKYSIAEKQEEGWFNVESLSNAGEIGAGADMTAYFTNVKMSTDTSLILGYKALTGTDGMNKPGLGLDSFRFQITPKSAEVEDTPVVPAPKADDEEAKPADVDSEQEPVSDPVKTPGDAKDLADNTDLAGEPAVQEIALPRIIARKMTLAPADMPLPENSNVVSSSDTGMIDFGKIEFTRAGTYVYEVTEIDKTDSEIDYSDKVWTITITVENVVTNNQVTGVKVTKVEYEDNDGNLSSDGFTFTNVFNGRPALDLHKSMSINGGPITDVKEAQPVNAGDSVTYYLTASVPGDATAAARDVVITDVVPAPVGDAAAKLTLIDKGTASFDASKNLLTWNVGDIGVNKAVTVSWTVRVPAVTVDTHWTNIAAAKYSNNPKDPDEEIPSNEVTVEEEPALPNVTIHKSQSVNKPGAAGVGGFSDSADPVMSEQGSLVVYELKVTNSGTASAKNVVVTDVIPTSKEEDLRLEFAQVYDGGTFDKGTQTVTWTIPELAPGASAWVHFSVKIPAASKWNSWTNQATVKHEDPKDPGKETPEEPSNKVTVETDVPALTIQKDQKLNDGEFTTDMLHGRDKDIVTYRLTISNTSKVEAKDVVLEDKVPTGTPETPLIVIPESIQGGNLYADGTIVWNLGTIPAGESREVTFQVRVPYVKELTRWLNVATVNYSNNPDGPDKPQESNKVEVEAKAPKLHLEKFQNFEDGQPVKTPLTSLGEEEIVTYTLRAVNEGEFTAENVIITDEIPDGTTLVKDSISDGGKERNGVIEWNVGNIEPGQANAKSVSFQVKLDPITVATTWKNGASAVYDNNPDNPTDPKDPKTPVDSNIVEIEGDVPALVIEKSQQKNDEAPATPILVDAGDTITYSLTVSNNGKAAAKDVVVKDPVPEGLELVENSISDGGTVKDGVITWNVGTMDPGAEKTVTFKVTVPKVTEATTWINAASTTYSNREDPEDPIPSNEVESKTDVPHLVIEKEQQKGEGDLTKDLMEVNGGDIVTYYVSVTNDGNAEARDVKVADTVPEGLTLVDGSISDKGTVKNGVITWKLGNLAKGEKRTVSFKVNVPEEQGMWRNIAYTSYPNNPDNEDPDNPKEEPSNPVDIIEWPEEGPKLLIDKTQALNNGTFTSEVLKGKAGDVVTYALTVRNVGKTTAEGITVTDVVPKGLTYVNGSASHDAVYENGKLTWYVETLEPGISVTLKFQAKLPMDNAAGSWKNVATLTYQNDPEGPEHETPSNEVEVKKDPNKVPTTSTNGKPHPGASAPTATNTGILTWTLLAAGAATGAAGLGIAGRRRRKPVSRKRK